MTRPDGPASPLPTSFAERDRRIGELETLNQRLRAERDQLQRQLADASQLLSIATTGLISLDKAGLISAANTPAARLLDTDVDRMLKKPFGLFIAPEDQAVFYINRSRIGSGALQAPFEVRLRTPSGAFRSARIHARPITLPDQLLPGLLLAVEDISDHRQALERLQTSVYLIDLVFTIIDDLSAWSTADIDDIINAVLEKIGLVSGADRVYICLLHTRRTLLSTTHEWLGTATRSAGRQPAPLKECLPIARCLKTRRPIQVDDVGTLGPDDRNGLDRLHPPEMRGFLLTPLYFSRYPVGIIGCDAVHQPVAWSGETRRLLALAGSAILNALVRRQAEQAPPSVQEDLLRFVAPAASSGDEAGVEYDGPIETIADDTDPQPSSEPRWRFVIGEPDDPDAVHTALLKNGKIANIACRHCSRQTLLDIDDIRTLGTRLKATCICGHRQYVKIELRREHRKAVSLEGVYFKGHGERPELKADMWGRIQIHNLSRNGIGFRLLGKSELRVGERFRVKFELDNSVGSIIQKKVVVRSIVGDIVGCQFEGHSSGDTTLGFYLLS